MLVATARSATAAGGFGAGCEAHDGRHCIGRRGTTTASLRLDRAQEAPAPFPLSRPGTAPAQHQSRARSPRTTTPLLPRRPPGLTRRRRTGRLNAGRIEGGEEHLVPLRRAPRSDGPMFPPMQSHGDEPGQGPLGSPARIVVRMASTRHRVGVGLRSNTGPSLTRNMPPPDEPLHPIDGVRAGRDAPRPCPAGASITRTLRQRRRSCVAHGDGLESFHRPGPPARRRRTPESMGRRGSPRRLGLAQTDPDPRTPYCWSRPSRRHQRIHAFGDSLLTNGLDLLPLKARRLGCRPPGSFHRPTAAVHVGDTASSGSGRAVGTVQLRGGRRGMTRPPPNVIEVASPFLCTMGDTPAGDPGFRARLSGSGRRHRFGAAPHESVRWPTTIFYARAPSPVSLPKTCFSIRPRRPTHRTGMGPASPSLETGRHAHATIPVHRLDDHSGWTSRRADTQPSSASNTA